jgi:hypothetical protein
MSEINRVPVADELDAISIRDMQASSAWKVYAAKIDLMIERAEVRCQDYSLDEPALRKAQYTLATLRDVKALPETICKEVQGRHR